MINEIPEYRYSDALPTWSCSYLWREVETIIATQAFAQRRAFDLGCGNGSTVKLLSDLGFEVIGVDPSESGLAVARANFPRLEFYRGSAYDNLAECYGRFPLVLSLEVVEHCFDPRKFAHTVYRLVEDNGIAIVSTPYHGYVKNLALSIAGKWDSHHGPLWDGGHIKFFSIATLRQLLSEAGFREIRFIRAGRIPPLAKSMIAVARK
jgi:2-polyprenyl-6-hydroxyphenyl methylase/3-demethylubiquinone-9 3-methyltransferase